MRPRRRSSRIKKRDSAPGVSLDAPWIAFAVAAFVLQRVLLLALGPDGWEEYARRAVVLSTTISVLVIALHFTRRFWMAWVLVAGATMNLLPIVAHGGLMPVSFEVVSRTDGAAKYSEEDIGRPAGHSKDILLWRDDIRFEVLSDRHVLTLSGRPDNIYSAGDVVLLGGLFLAALEAIYRLGIRPQGSVPS